MTLPRHVPLAGVLLFASPLTAQVIDMKDIPTKGVRAPDGPVRPGQPLPRNTLIAPQQKPAFAGQTRAPAVATRTPIEARVVTHNLSYPWGLAFIGDNRAIVTEKPGAMRIVDLSTGTIISSVLKVPNVVYGADAGLLTRCGDS